MLQLKTPRSIGNSVVPLAAEPPNEELDIIETKVEDRERNNLTTKSPKETLFQRILIHLRAEFTFIELQVNDRQLSKDYVGYIRQNHSPLSHLILNIIYGLYNAYIFIRVKDGFREPSRIYPGLNVILILCILGAAITCISGWLSFSVLFKLLPNSQSVSSKNDALSYLYNQQALLDTIFLYGVTITTALFCIGRVLMGQCEPSQFHGLFARGFCNNMAHDHAIPNDASLILTINILLAATVLRETNFFVLFSNWLLIAATYLFSAIYLNSNGMVMQLVVFVVSTPIIILDILRLNFEGFMKSRKLQEALSENERMAAEERASEMRHMIANIAHDLKTVSAATL